jgi:hypothetical protein
MAETVIEVTGRDMFAMLVESFPLDQDLWIILIHKTGRTTYRFPAVITVDGGEVNPHQRRDYNYDTCKWDIVVNQFATPEEHRLYQIKRRARIAANIRKAARRLFE